ncbi:MAG: magnesium/cobalt transporter CorA [Bacillota bacterium]
MTSHTRISIIDFSENAIQEYKPGEDEAIPVQEGLRWVNVEGLGDMQQLEKLSTVFGLHHLVMEDVLNTAHRPKIEDYEDYLFVVMKLFHYDNKSENLQEEQLSFILGSGLVISFLENANDLFNPIKDHLAAGKGRLRRRGEGFLAHALMDCVIDRYFLLLETVGDRIEHLQERVAGNPTPDVMIAIQNLRREVFFIRKALWPMREIASFFEKDDSPLLSDTIRPYFRDLHDHIIQLMDMLESYREILSDMVEIYLSSVSNRTNEIMKVLTIIATIFIPLTFITGIYGMNFVHMPELAWHWGYPLIWLVMFSVAAYMLNLFRRRKWF